MRPTTCMGLANLLRSTASSGMLATTTLPAAFQAVPPAAHRPQTKPDQRRERAKREPPPSWTVRALRAQAVGRPRPSGVMGELRDASSSALSNPCQQDKTRSRGGSEGACFRLCLRPSPNLLNRHGRTCDKLPSLHSHVQPAYVVRDPLIRGSAEQSEAGPKSFNHSAVRFAWSGFCIACLGFRIDRFGV